MPLDHSLEGRITYERRAPVWPPPDLQVDSGKLARKTGRLISNVVKRITKRNGSRSVEATGPIENIRKPARLIPRRTLTIKENHSESEHLASQLTQLQSPLFKLPLSIRQTIYELVLGNSNIHITSIKGGQQLSHMRCKCASCPGTAFYIERGKWKREWVCDELKYNLDTVHVHSQLLQTCRRVYSEVIDILYSSNILSFKDPKVLQNFVAWTLPQRCASVTTVHIDLQANMSLKATASTEKGTTEPSESVWDALATLPNIQNIQIRIHPVESGNASQKEVLANIKQLQTLNTLKRCRIYLPEELAAEEWMREAPFEAVDLKEWEWEHDFTRRPLSVF